MAVMLFTVLTFREMLEELELPITILKAEDDPEKPSSSIPEDLVLVKIWTAIVKSVSFKSKRGIRAKLVLFKDTVGLLSLVSKGGVPSKLEKQAKTRYKNLSILSNSQRENFL